MTIDRRRRPLIRDGIAERDASLFVIASEGEQTEPIYFKAFRGRRMQVVVLPSQGGRSAPSFVIEALDQYRQRHDIGDGDELWLVIDRDMWKVQALQTLHRDARNKGYFVAVSNPNFEWWLGFHFGPAPQTLTATAIRRELVAGLGAYQKNKYDVAQLLPLARDACARARDADIDDNLLWPSAPGSRVYLLMERVLAKLFR